MAKIKEKTAEINHFLKDFSGFKKVRERRLELLFFSRIYGSFADLYDHLYDIALQFHTAVRAEGKGVTVFR